MICKKISRFRRKEGIAGGSGDLFHISGFPSFSTYTIWHSAEVEAY